jgi:cell division protein FtsA
MVYNVVNCLAKCHLDIEEIVSSAYIAGFSCLTQDEKELGVILIDIGSTNTSYSIFFKNILIHSGVVPLGGMNVTSDIAKILSISMKNAERLKTLYGSSLVTFADNYKMIDVPLIGSESEEKEICSISNANLNNIIAARIEEIFNLIKFSINKASIDKALVERIVLTGGGSLISGVKEFAGSSFNSKIRIAKPTILEGLSPEDDFTNFASAIGVFEQISSKYQEASESGLGGASRHQSVREVVTSWIKENF